MKCKYCGKKGVQLKHYAQHHQKQLQAARRRHAGSSKRSRGHSSGGGKGSSSVHVPKGSNRVTLTFYG